VSGWKYVLLPGKNGITYPIIFPELFVHKEVSERFYYMDPNVGEGVISAGFVDGLSVVATSGLSETLGVSSRGEDASLINTHPYTKGMPDLGMNTKIEVMLLEKTMELLQMRIDTLKKIEGFLGE
jgi:hypothetical protein